VRRYTCAIQTRTASNFIGIVPGESWPRGPTDELAMFTRPLDLDDLLRE
jgi:hypothetical protein